MSKGIEERAKFDKIRYANCWEDTDNILKTLDENRTVLFN